MCGKSFAATRSLGLLAAAPAVLNKKESTFTASLPHHLAHPSEASPRITAASQARTGLQEQGWDPPSWDELAAGRPPPQGQADAGNGPAQPGWQ